MEPTRLPSPWDSSPGKSTGMGCHFLLQCRKVKSETEVPQPCPTLSDPMDCSLTGSSIPGIFQARVLEWGAIAFSSVYIYIYIPFHTLFHYGLLKDTEYSSLLYTVGSCCSSMLYITVCISQFQTINQTLLHSSPWATTGLFFISVSLFPFHR